MMLETFDLMLFSVFFFEKLETVCPTWLETLVQMLIMNTDILLKTWDLRTFFR